MTSERSFSSSTPPPFVFPTSGELPHRDASAGIALGKAGIRGVYQAGVAHALIMCGYYPRVVGTTSSGGLAGTVLALASELDDQDRRLELASDHIKAWENNPGEHVLSLLIKGPLGELARDIVDIDLSLGKLIDLVASALDGEKLPLLRLAWALPLASAPRVLPLLLSLVEAFILSAPGEERQLRMAQRVLSAYGMDRSLVSGNLVDSHFGDIVAKYAPKEARTTLADLATHLVFSVASLSLQCGDSAPARLTEISKPSDDTRPDFASANLLAAMRAGCAFAPFFAGVQASELTPHLPRGVRGDDILMDAAVAQKDPLSAVISHWARRPAPGPFRLFAVYHDPIDEMPAPSREVEKEAYSPFLGAALHSLNLFDRLDQQFAAKVVSMVTEMVEAIEKAASEGQNVSLPARLGGGRYVAVHTTDIAPRERIPFGVVSVPGSVELLAACASGCRSALEALHGPLIKTIGRGEQVKCANVLDAARAQQEGTPESARDRYFRPVERLCGSCTGMLAPPPEQKRMATRDEVEAANAFKFFHENEREKEPGASPQKPRPLTIVVPAGGVFLGIFQVGAIAALKQYKIFPDLYAGASVGTLFSYLLQACVTEEEPINLRRIVQLVRTVPEWIDAAGDSKSERAGRRGLVRALMESLTDGWRSEDVKPLRDLLPSDIVKMLAADDIIPGSAEERTWTSFRRGLGAWLFTPRPSRRTSEARTLPRSYSLESNEWAKVRGLFQDLGRLRLARTLPLLDDIAANLDMFTPGPKEDEGEILGFTSLEQKLRDVIFSDQDVTLEEHSIRERARFIFTVTNHTRGVPEYFGYHDGSTPIRPSPNAIEACLAAASFPLAFRRRARDEIFRKASVAEPAAHYADGGILNNFPSDTAFAYLHALSGAPDTRWIGHSSHRVLLLSLTSPSPYLSICPSEDRLLYNLVRAGARSEDEKADKTLKCQEHINALARSANSVLCDGNGRQGIVADIDLITPTYAIYPHAFAINERLGFEEKKQLEMVASGCRRARLALEWRTYDERMGGKDTDEAAHKVRVEMFRHEVRREVDLTMGKSSPYPPDSCVFGRFNPNTAHIDQPEPIACPFAKDESMRDVFRICKKTVDTELSVPDLKLYRRLA